MSSDPIFQIVFDGQNNQHFYQSLEKAQEARLVFAKKSIRNFNKVWNDYRNWWERYHQVEYPQYQAPPISLLMEQFLSEECGISIQEVDIDEDIEGHEDYFGDRFYEDLAYTTKAI